MRRGERDGRAATGGFPDGAWQSPGPPSLSRPKAAGPEERAQGRGAEGGGPGRRGWSLRAASLPDASRSPASRGARARGGRGRWSPGDRGRGGGSGAPEARRTASKAVLSARRGLRVPSASARLGGTRRRPGSARGWDRAGAGLGGDGAAGLQLRPVAPPGPPPSWKPPPLAAHLPLATPAGSLPAAGAELRSARCRWGTSRASQSRPGMETSEPGASQSGPGMEPDVGRTVSEQQAAGRRIRSVS